VCCSVLQCVEVSRSALRRVMPVRVGAYSGEIMVTLHINRNPFYFH